MALYNFALASGDKAKESQLPLSYWAATEAATEAAFASLFTVKAGV
ncbi:MAG: hypothetical protein RR960_07840 [Alistipes sp.]